MSGTPIAMVNTCRIGLNRQRFLGRRPLGSPVSGHWWSPASSVALVGYYYGVNATGA